MRDPINEPGRHVAWLLTELEHQTNNRLSTETQQNLLAEVSAHLDATIRARLELGMDSFQAEKEAVELFGHPRAYIGDLLCVHETEETPNNRWQWLRGDRATVIYSSGFLFTWLLLHCILNGSLALMTSTAVLLRLTAVTLFGAAIAIRSFNFRKIQVAPLVISSIGGYVLGMVVLTSFWTTFNWSGRTFILPNSLAKEVLDYDQSNVGAMRMDFKKLARGLWLHTHDLSPTQLAALTPMDRRLLFSSVMWTPQFRNHYSEQQGFRGLDIDFTFTPVSSYRSVNRVWQDNTPTMLNKSSEALSVAQSQISGIENSHRHFPVNLIRNMLTYGSQMLPAFFFLLVANVVGTCLGSVRQLLLRRSRVKAI